MRLTPLRLAVVLLVFGTACSGLAAVSGAIASPFAGTWAQREAVAGTSFVLTLTAEGATVGGTGTYTIEGGRSGTFTPAGSVQGGRLLLAFKYGDSEAQFDGELASAPVLTGALHFGSRLALTPSAIVSFDKKN